MGWDRLVRIASRLAVAVGLAALVALSPAPARAQAPLLPARAQAPLLPARAQAPLLNETLELSGTVLFLESKAPGLVIGAVRNGETAVLALQLRPDMPI